MRYKINLVTYAYGIDKCDDSAKLQIVGYLKITIPKEGFMRKSELEVSVILPCRNEATTVGACVDEAEAFLKQHAIEGEILVVDNASTDSSAMIAGEKGARVISEQAPGYGNALRAGIGAAIGNILLMVDCDTTYDIRELYKLYNMIKNEGFDLVIGDRFTGSIEEGAMPLSHVFGGKFLSAIGRKRFHTDINDFHCGMRGMTRDAADRLMFKTEGMEFATEMIALASKHELKVGQVPVSLKNSLFPRRSKLRTIRDGFRHLGYIIKKC